MADIPVEFQTLLASKVMIGDNLPTGVVTVGGMVIPDIISISVARSKGTASQATVAIDNEGGLKAGDPAGPYNHILWPNKIVTITLGYGAAQFLVFTGFVDDVNMNATPGSATITITARDYSKLAIDQMVQMMWGEEMVYEIVYQWQTLEYTFGALAALAGYDPGKTHVESTGITLPELLFSRESYADAFQKICELSLFEWFCDEQGDLWFRKAVDPAPTAVFAFVEGVDIVNLNYVISDAEIYSKVVVQTTGIEGGTWQATASCNESVFGVPVQKTMFVNLMERMTDSPGCSALAVMYAAAVDIKSRLVTFAIVGNPNVKIGDCVSVTETTTSISEIYRVFDLSHSMDANNSLVFGTTIKCYHYASGA
jgi:hypothetical protein